jgi:hypothetical protein
LPFADLADELFALSPHIRYLALGRGQDVQLRERPGLTDSSSSESDRFEELFVNPTLLTLVRQRGELDCGGVAVVVAYGAFFQLIFPLDGFHASVAVSLEADPVALVGPIRQFLIQYTGYGAGVRDRSRP